jgi:hypothetical protein
MSINMQLRDLYYSKLPELISIIETIGNEDVEDYTGPFLTQCWEEKYLSSDFKILFVGQEANGWTGFDRPKTQNAIDGLLERYIKFELGANYNTTFWQHIHYINQRLNNADLNFAWSNVLKFGRSGNGRPTDAVVEQELLKFNILEAEIKILDPDVAIFFSGPNYDLDISQRISGVKFLQCENNELRALARLSHPSLPKKTYRTYHPSHLRQSKKEDIRDEIIKLVKGQ